MKQMMKQMGIDMDDEELFNEEDEYDKVLKQMGIDPNKNDDQDILNLIGDGNDEDDDALIRQLDQHIQKESPLE